MVGYVSGKSKIEVTAQRLVFLIVRVCVCVRVRAGLFCESGSVYIPKSQKKKNT